MKITIAFILLAYCLNSCVIEEHYVFDKENNGHYKMTFDFSSFIEGKEAEESSKEFMDEMTHAMDSIMTDIQDIKGATNLAQESADGKLKMSYDFDGLETLEEVDAMGEDANKNYKVFEMVKGSFVAKPNMGEMKKSMSSGESKEDMEAAEMMAQMIEWNFIVSFEHDVEVKKMKYFTDMGGNRFKFSTEEHGFNLQPILQLKE
jgi:hypothetical protein